MWDIHGNPLTKGHCEVHPHIKEEYPCHVCLEQQHVAYIHQKAAEIVDYEATLEEKLHQARSMAGLTADQYTVNLLGAIHEEVTELLMAYEAIKVKSARQTEQLKQQEMAIRRLKESKHKVSIVAANRGEKIKELQRIIKIKSRKKVNNHA